MTAWIQSGLIERLFKDAPTGPKSAWIGPLLQLDCAREVLPFRCSALSYVVLFLSPHAECDDDEAFMAQQLDSLCVEGFLPSRNARLIKLCRADADEQPFKPEKWPLRAASHIFRFLDTVAEAAKVYVAASPHIQQYLFLPANARLGRLYARLCEQISSEMNIEVQALLPATGALYAYQRTSSTQPNDPEHERSQSEEVRGSGERGLSEWNAA